MKKWGKFFPGLILRLCLHVSSTLTVFCNRLKIGFHPVLWVPFKHNVKKIKGTADKNGDVDGTCNKRALIFHGFPTQKQEMIFINLFHTFTIFAQRNSNSPRKFKDLFTPRESLSYSEKDHTTSINRSKDMRQTSKKIFAFAAAYHSVWIDLKRLTSVLAALATLHSRSRMLAPLVLLLRRSSALTVLVVSIRSSLSSFLDNAREILPKNWRTNIR